MHCAARVRMFRSATDADRDAWRTPSSTGSPKRRKRPASVGDNGCWWGAGRLWLKVAVVPRAAAPGRDLDRRDFDEKARAVRRFLRVGLSCGVGHVARHQDLVELLPHRAAVAADNRTLDNAR